MPKGTRPQGAEERFQSRLTKERARAKTLLKKVEEEFKGVPKMPSTENVKMGGDSLSRGVTALGVVINDGIRSLRGKETSQEMKVKINRLRRYLRQTKSIKESLPFGSDSLTSRRDARDVPRLKNFR